MQVGELNEAGDSFDIKNLEETNALLIRNDAQTKFIYKDEENRAVMLRRTLQLPDEMPIGTSLKMSSVAGYATHSVEKRDQVARTLAPVDWNDLSAYKTKTITVNGVDRLCALVPVLLTL